VSLTNYILIGGGGGGGSSCASSGAGGGGSGLLVSGFLPVKPGDLLNFEIGAGGNSDSGGEPTSISLNGTLVIVAAGGSAGKQGSGIDGGDGGTGGAGGGGGGSDDGAYPHPGQGGVSLDYNDVQAESGNGRSGGDGFLGGAGGLGGIVTINEVDTIVNGGGGGGGNGGGNGAGIGDNKINSATNGANNTGGGGGGGCFIYENDTVPTPSFQGASGGSGVAYYQLI
jgi:hypothetical protein